MAEEVSLEEYKKAYREVVSEEEKRDFLVHLVVYVLVNAMLIAINFIYSPEAIWFFYPLIGWGIGISIHYLSGVRWIQKELEEKEAKAEYKAREAKGLNLQST
ncbi:MAG: histidine kinase [Candidatus Methanophagaceae archaeon]|nr:MAG: histidine kinase [Methanophagales archaeon]